MILHEGWVDKESKYLGRWRPRWLVLFRDRASHLPVLCTFKDARHVWDPLETPRCVATERLHHRSVPPYPHSLACLSLSVPTERRRPWC